jgi:hypothetical protein
LETVHPASHVAPGHLLVDNAAPCRHPLDVSGGDGAAVPQAVAVLHRSRQDICDGFDAAVGVPWEAGQVILWNVVAEVIEKKERVEVGRVTEAKRAPQADPAPSTVGLARASRLMGRMDTIASRH